MRTGRAIADRASTAKRCRRVLGSYPPSSSHEQEQACRKLTPILTKEARERPKEGNADRKQTQQEVEAQAGFNVGVRRWAPGTNVRRRRHGPFLAARCRGRR